MAAAYVYSGNDRHKHVIKKGRGLASAGNSMSAPSVPLADLTKAFFEGSATAWCKTDWFFFHISFSAPLGFLPYIYSIQSGCSFCYMFSHLFRINLMNPVGDGSVSFLFFLSIPTPVVVNIISAPVS